jgi:hypothetical protein
VRDDYLDACLQRERRKNHASVEDLRALLQRHGIKMDAATFASISVSSIHLEWRCFSYNEAIRLGVVYG